MPYSIIYEYFYSPKQNKNILCYIVYYVAIQYSIIMHDILFGCVPEAGCRLAANTNDGGSPMYRRSLQLPE